MRRPSFLLRLAVAVLAAVLALALAEVALRVGSLLIEPGAGSLEEELAASAGARPSEDQHSVSLRGLVCPSRNPSLVYELKPGLECRFRGVEVSINPLGMRDRAYPMDKPPGTVRIVGLGDSVMFGWGVEESAGYLRLAEEELNGRSPPRRRYEVMNFAVPGYNTAMEVAAYAAKAALFDPDLVILHVVHNDLGLPRFMLAPPRVWRLDRLWLADLARRGWRAAIAGGWTWVEPRQVAWREGGDLARVPRPYRHLVGEAAYVQALDDLERRTAASHIPVLVVIQQRDGEPYRRLVAAAEERGFSVVEVGPYLIDYQRRHGVEQTLAGFSDTFWLSPTDPHPNPLAHRLYARAVVDAVVATLPPSSGGAPVRGARR